MLSGLDQENADPQFLEQELLSTKVHTDLTSSTKPSFGCYDEQLQLSQLSNQILLLKNELNEKDLQLLEVKSSSMAHCDKLQTEIRLKNEELRARSREIAA